jgi:hypothetical protein
MSLLLLFKGTATEPRTVPTANIIRTDDAPTLSASYRTPIRTTANTIRTDPTKPIKR